MRALEANAVLIGQNAAFEEYWKKTGHPFVRVSAEEDWPTAFALYIWLERGMAPIEKLNRSLVFGQTLWVPEDQKSAFGSFKGEIQVFPSEWLTDIVAEGGSCIKSFQFGGRFVKEEVCRVPRRRFRLAMGERVQALYRSKGLTSTKLLFYPAGFRTLFSFRVDADEFETEAFERFFQTAKKYSHAVSIFFSMANYDRQIEQIRRCVEAGFDVHSHAYTHYTYRSYAQNVFNVKKAASLLSKVGSVAHGFASPYGRWNANLQKALEDLHYEFSSEFSYNYDDFPSYPVVNGRRSAVLQVPVHPVGLGVYMEAGGGYNEDEVRAYYKKLFYERYDASEPIIFYDHPTKWLGYHPEFMDFLFGLVAQHKDIWQCSMTDWARRWRSLDQEAIYADEPERSPGSQASLWDEGQPVTEKDPIKCVRSAVKKWLDWETSTPTQDIIRESLPSYIKFVMRCCHKLF